MALYTKIKGSNNYTVEGNLIIEDGIVNGFSATNYISLPSIINTKKILEKKIEIVLSFTTGSSFNQYEYLFSQVGGGYGGISIRLYNGKVAVLSSYNGTSWTAKNSSYICSTNTKYLLKYTYDNVNYNQIIYLYNNNQWNEIFSFNEGAMYGINKDIALGSGASWDNPFNGSIDLNETYIKIDNFAWFGYSFSKVKVKSGLVRYTVVGSPTITNGIASNFSASNYLTLPRLNTQGLKKVEFGFCLVNVGGQNYRQYFSMTGLSLCISNGGGVGINYSGSSYYNWNTPPSTGEVLIKSIFDIENSQLIISWTSDGQIYKTSTYQLSFITHLDSIMNIGNGGISIIEAINLKRSYIKVDDKYYWRGFDYQNINAWKIQQDNFSKYYTIVDGKLMWANPNTYLEGTGTQYIDTGFKADQNTRVVCKFSCNNTSLTQFIFGSRTSYNSNEFSFGIVDQVFRDTWRTSYTATSVYPSVNKIYTIDKNKNITYLNNEVLVNNTMNSFNSANNLLLFAVPNSNGPSFYYNGKIFNSQIYDNGILIHHFVPVPKGFLIGNFVVPSNGMFDIVEQKFYENKGTGEFTIGGIPDDYIIEGGKLIWCNPDIYLENPSNYQEYINTTIIPTNDMRFRVIAQLTDTTNEYDGCLFGSRKDSSATGKQFCVWNFKTSGNIGSFIYGDKWYGNYPGTAGQKYTFEYDGINYTINGTSPSTGVWIGDKNINSTLPIFLFGLNQNGSIESRRMRGKVFEFILWSNSTILQYLIPVPKGMLIGDKIAPSNCMFDMVTQTFFENQGAGNFIIGGLSGDYINVGDNIVWVNENVYLKCNGAQYFDSGFKANQDTKVDIDYTPMESGIMTLYSCRDGAKLNTFTCFSPVSGTSSTRYDYNTTQNTISSNPIAGTRRHILADKNKFYIDDVLKYTATYANFQSTNNMIFGCSYAPELDYSNYSKFKYHKIQLYNNEKLIRYFLPVNTNTVIGNFTVPSPGMWDAVTRKFYPNKGAGAFTYGKDS